VEYQRARCGRPGEEIVRQSPVAQDRIADVQRMLAAVPASQLQGLTSDTEAFQAMKRRVMALPPAPKQTTTER